MIVDLTSYEAAEILESLDRLIMAIDNGDHGEFVDDGSEEEMEISRSLSRWRDRLRALTHKIELAGKKEETKC